MSREVPRSEPVWLARTARLRRLSHALRPHDAAQGDNSLGAGSETKNMGPVCVLHLFWKALWHSQTQKHTASMHPKPLAQAATAALGAVLSVNSMRSSGDSTRGSLSVADDGTFISTIPSSYESSMAGSQVGMQSFEDTSNQAGDNKKKQPSGQADGEEKPVDKAENAEK
jgi:hypothetical protein